MNNTATTEDRIWAVISHLSALAFGMGILLPIIGWAEQRRKSNYASFQCLQALGYQSLGYTVWILFSGILAIVFVIIMLPTLNTATEPEKVGFWFTIFVIFIFGLFSIYFIFPIIAAIACALGKDFHYPMLGDRLARYLGYDLDNETTLNERHEERWVAAASHFSVIIALWGMLAPLSTWLTQGKQNLFLKFQSIQTLVFQGFMTIFYFVAGVVYLLGIFLLFAIMGLMGTPDTNSSVEIFSLFIFFVSFLIALVVVLVIPLMHILGQWAGYRILKGDDYRYPLIGRLVEDRILKRTNSDMKEELV